MKRRFPRLCALLLIVSAISLVVFPFGNVKASTLVPQTPLAGKSIPQYVDPLPVFGPAGPIPRVDALAHPNLTVTMEQITQQVLPTANAGGVATGFGPTKAWAYRINDTSTSALLGPAHWPAVTVQAQRGIPTTVFYVNNLPSYAGDPTSIQGLMTVDQTIHWADPLGLMCSQMATPPNCVTTPADPCCVPYTGPVPAVVIYTVEKCLPSSTVGPNPGLPPDWQ